mmetsp:Transcript_120827/g.341650  ORF Transcript_120827/g.341650 Transcript_120827/m.341650 type:complete len:409 (-) Transcript_120827:1786-3012(-)
MRTWLDILDVGSDARPATVARFADDMADAVALAAAMVASAPVLPMCKHAVSAAGPAAVSTTALVDLFKPTHARFATEFDWYRDGPSPSMLATAARLRANCPLRPLRQDAIDRCPILALRVARRRLLHWANAGFAVALSVFVDTPRPLRDAVARSRTLRPIGPLAELAVLAFTAAQALVAESCFPPVAKGRFAARGRFSCDATAPVLLTTETCGGALRPLGPCRPLAVHTRPIDVARLRVAGLHNVFVQCLAWRAAGVGHLFDVTSAPLEATSTCARASAPFLPVAPHAVVPVTPWVVKALAVLPEVYCAVAVATGPGIRQCTGARTVARTATGRACRPIRPRSDLTLPTRLVIAAPRHDQVGRATLSTVRRELVDLPQPLLLATAATLVALAPISPHRDAAIHDIRTA